MSLAKLIDYYIEKSAQPEFELSQIRKELEAQQLPDEDIRIVVRRVDNALQRRAFAKTTHAKINELMIAGAILTLVGAGITIATYTGAIDMGNSFLIVYGPLVVGLSLLIGGWVRKN